MVYLITYDLNKVGKNYDGLIRAIQALSTEVIRPLKSVWLVDTGLSAQTIYDHLASSIDADDYLLVIRVRPEYQGWLTPSMWQWINSSKRDY